MTLKDFFLSQLDREATLNRKTIDRVPEGRNDFKPHQRSMELGYLAALVAHMPGWIALMIDRDELNLDDPASENLRTKALDTHAELVASLDASLANGRRALESIDDAHLARPWTFKMGGRTVQEAPRHMMIAGALSHLAHHRGQLTVYLRLVDAKVPALYGPSADEHF